MKPSTKEYILYDSTFIRKMNGINSVRKQITDCPRQGIGVGIDREEAQGAP